MQGYGYDLREDFFWYGPLGGSYGPSTYPYGPPKHMNPQLSFNKEEDFADSEVYDIHPDH